MDLPAPSSVWLERADGARVPVVGNCGLGRAKSNAVKIADEAFLFRQQAVAEADSATAGLPTVQEVRQVERWMVLADIEGFTPLSQRLPPGELATLVGQWVRAGREIVEAHGGTVNKYLGDGWLACWTGGAPSTAQVIAAAVEALRVRRAETELEFRGIVHHGTVSVGGAAGIGEESLMGPEVNFIFRVEKIVGGMGAAFCFTEAAQALLAPALGLEPIPGRHALQGFPGDYALFQLPQPAEESARQ
jgi:adenylate cyclase